MVSALSPPDEIWNVFVLCCVCCFDFSSKNKKKRGGRALLLVESDPCYPSVDPSIGLSVLSPPTTPRPSSLPPATSRHFFLLRPKGVPCFCFVLIFVALPSRRLPLACARIHFVRHPSLPRPLFYSLELHPRFRRRYLIVAWKKRSSNRSI